MPLVAGAACIFCSNPLNDSDEHIIPDSVNGRLHSKTLICSACNKLFGENLDPIIKEALQVVLFALGFDNVKKMRVTDQDGKPYTIDQDGKMQEVAPSIEVFKVGEQTGISVSGEKRTAIRAFAKKATRTFGAHALKLLDGDGFHVEEKTTFLSEVKGMAASETTPNLKLALNKVLTDFYAHSALPSEPIQERLGRIHKLDETGNDIVMCNFDLSVRQTKNGEVSHLLVIRSDKEKKQLYGYIEILNILCGYTVFVNDYDGPDVDVIYHQNALTGERLKEEVAINTGAVTAEGANFDKLVNNVLENARSAEQMNRFQTLLNEIKAELDDDLKKGKISQSEREQQFLEAAVNLAAEMMVFEFPDDVADFTVQDEFFINYGRSVIKESGKEKFEFFYHQLVGREFPCEDDGLVYVRESYKYKKHVPKNGENRVMVFCYFKAKGGTREKYFPVKEIFDVLGLPPPPIDYSTWLWIQ